MKKSLLLIYVFGVSLILCAGSENGKNNPLYSITSSTKFSAKMITLGGEQPKIERKKNYTTLKNDAAGRIIGMESKEQGFINYRYDDLGNLSEIDKNGIEKEIYSYDMLGRRIKIEYRNPMGNDNVEFEYSTAPESYLTGELQNKIEKNETSRYFYNNKRLIEERKTILGKEFNVGYHYNDKGLLATIEYPSGLLVEYEYNSENKKQVIYATIEKERRLLYRQNDNEKERTEIFGNGLKTIRTVDSEKRSMSIKSGELIDWEVKFDQKGMIASVLDKKDIMNKRVFNYDGEYRLIKAYGPWGICRYRYDEMDNMIFREEKGSKLEFAYRKKDSRIKTLKINDIEVPVAYDKLGRMIQKGDMIFQYNERGRLCSINKKKEVLVELQYNYKNQRVIEKNGDKTKVFVYDDNTRVLGEYENLGQISREYIYWEEMPIAFIQDGKMFYYHYDPMNFPVLVTDENGRKVRKVNYKPNGEILNVDGNIDDSLRFPGQYKLNGININYNFQRNYNPLLGTYLEPDPVCSIDNAYTYCRGNPVNLFDPKGLSINYYYADHLDYASLSLSIGEIMQITGTVFSNCFRKSNGDSKYYRIVGHFEANFLLANISLSPINPSVAETTSKTVFHSMNDQFPYPTMSEFNGKATLLAFNVQIGYGGYSLSGMILGNAKTGGSDLYFGWVTPDIGFSLNLTGSSAGILINEECCGDIFPEEQWHESNQ